MSRVGMFIGLMLAGCEGSGDDAEVTLPDAASAESAAEGVVGGTASDAEEVSEEGYDLWEVYVTIANGAELEVLLFKDDGALFEVKDEAGPFDYTNLDPLPGQLTWVEARDVALGQVEGELVLWEVKFTEEGYFYEFYVEEVGDQLWEIKLWADGGEVFTKEAVDEVD
jgi:hypothetical protein